MLDPDGSEVDWFVGYGPPPERYKEQVDRALEGIDTFKTLRQKSATDPESVEVAFKLGVKYDRRYQRDKAAEFYRKVLELDPDGTKGTTAFMKGEVSFTQYAEYNLGAGALGNRPPDPAPLLAFVKKYPDSDMIRMAYQRLGQSYFVRTASQDEATAFYEEYAGRYPKNPLVLTYWIQRIIRDKGPYEKGLELAQKALSLMSDAPNPRIILDIARLYLDKGDTAKALGMIDLSVENAGDSAGGINPSAAALYMRAGAKDKALEAYGPEYAAKYWDNASQLARYAAFWIRNPDINQADALKAAERAVELAPDTYNSWSTLSDVHFSRKDYEKALAAAERALSAAPPGRAKELVQKKIERIRQEIAKK